MNMMYGLKGMDRIKLQYRYTKKYKKQNKEDNSLQFT